MQIGRGMRNSIIKTALTTTAFLLAGLANAQNAAIVNGKPIPSDMLDFVLTEQAKRGAPNTPEVRTSIRERMIQQEVLSQEAVKKGLARKKQFQYQTALTEKAILADSLRQDFFANLTIGDDEMQAAYDNINKMLDGNEYRASHILLEKEEEAREVISQLDAGKSFSELAKEKSKDPGSAVNGGDLDWANPQDFVPEFSEAMVGLEKGSYSKQPVKSQFGYHVILLADVRKLAAPPLEEIKPQLRERLLDQKWEEYVQQLVAKAKIQ